MWSVQYRVCVYGVYSIECVCVCVCMECIECVCVRACVYGVYSIEYSGFLFGKSCVLGSCNHGLRHRKQRCVSVCMCV